MGFEFLNGSTNNFIWIPGSGTFADADSKNISTIIEPLRILIHSRIIPFEFKTAEARTAIKSIG